MRTIWLWWSTGKDSAWALHLLRGASDVRVERLITTTTPTFDRVAIHGTRTSVLDAQASAVGLPVRRVELPYPCSNEQYETAVRPVLDEARHTGVHAMAFGDLFLADVRAYREALLSGTGIEPVFPLWGQDTRALADAMIAAGLEARITCLDPRQLDRARAGARYDGAFLDGLPDSVDPCGERGEFHTVATAGPVFEHALEVRPGSVVERDGFVYADLELA